ncbi:succinyl-CoA--D-citramalate CoA-transferase [Favolaschia claudopus]|uniref:Succinyl-CoA--D-citramalate CoA-transferase n=1 Tax=Favolaschia claudopus TaxID=2862362 RepID=A0AAW0AGU5_9AGAR
MKPVLSSISRSQRAFCPGICLNKYRRIPLSVFLPNTRRNLETRASISNRLSAQNDLPLAGIRVLELGQLIAGPFAGQLLGQFGAEIIKVESPKKGDPLRVWRELDVDGCSPWFRSIGRNKKSVAIDLHTPGGRELVRKLALRSDVLIENFKPGTLEKWYLDPASIHPHNPDLIYTRVSGYGQTGPWASRPGFASVCEAESGFRFINGFPDPETGGLNGPPVRPNISLGDSVAGLHAAFGTVLALLQRQKKKANGQAGGTTVDVSILESMLNLMEGIIPTYDRLGAVRGPSGSSVTGIVPTNAYPCLPSPSSSSTSPTPTYIVIGANTDSLYTRLMHLIGAPHLTTPLSSEYLHNHHRVKHQAVIEKAITDWTSSRSVDEVERKLREAGVPVGRVVSVREIVDGGAEREGERMGGVGEQLKARGAVREVWVPHANAKSDGKNESANGWALKMPSTFPILEGVDPAPRWAGPDLGTHTDEVLMGELLGLKKEEVRRFREEGIVG